MLNLISYQPDIDKDLKYCEDSKAFIQCSSDMGDIYKNIEEYNLRKEGKILIVFYDIIADILSNRKLNPVVTKFVIRGRKLNISLVSITQLYFVAPKNIRLNYTHYFIMKIPNKWELQQITFNHSSDTDFKDFMNPYKICTEKQYSFLVTDTTLASVNPLHFMKNLLQKLDMKNYRAAAKISALSLSKINKYGYCTGEEILPSNQSQMIEHILL